MSKEDDRLAMITYSIWRTGSARQRHYQINKLTIGVDTGDKYWVQLNGRDKFWCDCPGFRRQKFPAIDHKHVKIAMDFHDRGEPAKALYKIHGTGVHAKIEYLGAKAL